MNLGASCAGVARRAPAPASPPGRGIASVLAGSAGGQLLVVLSMPLLTRLYPVTEFAVLAVFTALFGLLAPVAAGRLDAAVPLPERDLEAAGLVWAAVLSTVLFGALLGLAGWAFGGLVGTALGVPGLDRQWAPLGLAIISAGLLQTASAWLVRQRRYPALGLRDLAAGCGTVLTQLGLGLAGACSVGLTLGVGCGRLAGLLAAGRRINRGNPGNPGTASSPGRRPARPAGVLVPGPAAARTTWAAVLRYRRFPLVASGSALLNTTGTYAPVLVVSAAYGELTVALVGLTVRVLSAPAALVTTAVARVYEGEAAAAVRTGSPGLAGAIRGTVTRLLLLGAGPALIVLLFGPSLFAAVFGARWLVAGVFAQVLSIGYLARFAVAAVSQTLLILQRQSDQLRWDLTRVLLTVGAPAGCWLLGAPAVAAVAALSASYLVTYTALLVRCLRAAARFDATARSDAPAREAG